jgi:hypothetical protein
MQIKKLKARNFKTFSLVFLSLFFVFSAGLALAGACSGPIVPCGETGNPCKFCHLFVLFNNIINFILFCLVPPVAALMMVMGGGYVLIAGENLSNVEKGKSIIKAVVIGLLIVFGAWIIINAFFFVIGVSSWTGLEKGWFQINCQ